MIHQLLKLERPLFVFDIEATGLDTQTARIVELAFARYEATGLTKEWSSRLNPGVPIPESATKVHGITDADVADKPRFKQIAANLASGFTDCDFCGQNVRYDLRVLAAEFTRCKQPWGYANARILDSGKLEQLAVPRTLSDLHKKYTGEEHEGAHGALSDVRASTTVITKQLETYETLPRDLGQLHELSWPGWLTSDGGFRMVNGVPTIMFGKHKGAAMQSVPRTYWDWMLSADFNEEVKQLARDAKMGKYPEAK